MSERPDINEINRDVIAQFRANHGRVLSGRFAGSKLLLLTTRGANTGATRVNPMMYVEDASRYVVFASKRGAPTNPDWYHNLIANPDVTVEVGDESFTTRAVVARGAERQRLWDGFRQPASVSGRLAGRHEAPASLDHPGSATLAVVPRVRIAAYELRLERAD